MKKKREAKGKKNIFLAVILRIAMVAMIVATYYFFSYLNFKPIPNGMLTFFIWVTLIPSIISYADSITLGQEAIIVSCIDDIALGNKD